MSDYDVTLEQFKSETGWSQKKFDTLIDEHGWDYVIYYRDRWHEAMAGYGSFDPECY